ncbi:MAG: VOC family protein [Dehalococcoidia bacterium]
MTRDLDASTCFWTDILEVPLVGEVRTPTTIIRQFQLSDAVVELLGPTSPDSPVARRRPGLLSMAAFEVTDMAAAVAQARAAGFTVADPAPGSLPGTRVTSIAGAELSGFTLQLLEYV